MIKLFITDLDGCISHPFKTPDWEAVNKIRDYNIRSRSSEVIPQLTICTGRPLPYAEAVAQWLDVQLPFVFESAGLFYWEGNRIETALGTANGALKPIREMKKWVQQEIVPDYPDVLFEFAKMMDAGVVCHDESIINQIHERVLEKVAGEFPELEVHATEVSVNTLISGNNKFQGIKLIGKALEVELHEMAYIGDSSGDVPALSNVKMPFVPKNAREIAKGYGEVLPFETTEAVLAAYERIIDYNKKQLS